MFFFNLSFFSFDFFLGLIVADSLLQMSENFFLQTYMGYFSVRSTLLPLEAHSGDDQTLRPTRAAGRSAQRLSRVAIHYWS